MRIEGMRDGEMDHLQIEEEQDRGQPSQSQPLHEPVKCIFPFMRFVFSFPFFLKFWNVKWFTNGILFMQTSATYDLFYSSLHVVI